MPAGCWIALAIFLCPLDSLAGAAEVVSARVDCTSDSTCRFTVTVEHADTDWEHYADRWEVLSLEGEVLATRVLRHPHVDEQPFTRSLSGVRIPSSVLQVRIRARDSMHGHGGKEAVLELPHSDAPARRPDP
jgi:hypothetical protein